MSIKKFKPLLILGSLLTLVIFVFLFQKTFFIYISKAFEDLGSYKTQKQMDIPVPTELPLVCNCDQCQVRIK